MENEVIEIGGVALTVDGADVEFGDGEDSVRYHFEDAWSSRAAIQLLEDMVDRGEIGERIHPAGYDGNFVIVDQDDEIFARAYRFGRDAVVAYNFVDDFNDLKCRLNDDDSDDDE